MTLHNLNDQISWLLQNRQIPPAGRLYDSRLADTEDVEIIDAQSFNSVPVEDNTPNLEAILSRPVPQTPNVARDFVPPAVSSRAREAAPARGIGTSALNSMANEHQLATPAPTKGSLSAAWTASFHKDDGLSARLSSNKATSSSTEIAHAPRTPHPTAQSFPARSHKIVAVDLTGEDDVENERPSSDSSSTFGEPLRLWREDSALRAEPLPPRRGKKRKSDEIVDDTQEGEINCCKTSANGGRHLLSRPPDDFIDIDELNTCEEPPPPYTTQAPVPVPKIRGEVVKLSVESSETGSDSEGEFHVTETVSRTETVIRKSLSRKTPAHHGKIASKSTTIPTLAPNSGYVSYQGRDRTPNKIDTCSRGSSPAKDNLRQLASPSINASQRSQHCRVIRDSDDDEDALEVMAEAEWQSALSLPTAVENSQQKDMDLVSQHSSTVPCSPKHQHRIIHEATNLSLMEMRKPDLFGPGEQCKGPFTNHERDEQANYNLNHVDIAPPSTSSAPPQVLEFDDKKLVKLYLEDPSTLVNRLSALEDMLRENQSVCMKLLEDGSIPAELKSERRKLLEQKKCLKDLQHLHAEYGTLTTRKRELVKKIMTAIDAAEDTSDLENTNSTLMQAVRRLEGQMGQLLRASRATESFYINSKLENNLESFSQTSHIDDRTSGSTIASNNQRTLQAQMPSRGGISIPDSRDGEQRDARDLKPMENPEMRLATNYGIVRKSRSPSRKPLAPLQNNIFSVPTTGQQYNMDLSIAEELVTRKSSTSRVEDPDILHEEVSGGRSDVYEAADLLKSGHNIEEDFGDLDDDDEMLEIAENFELLHSFKDSDIPDKIAYGNSSTPAKTWKPVSTKNDLFPVSPGRDDLFQYPWSKDVKAALRERFHLRGFRQNQLEAINATLDGKDTFVLMPTGGGKSLCYQLPAVVQSGKTKGITVVISPLISLMQDQVEHLQLLNIKACFINGELPAEERARIIDDLGQRHPENSIQLLYVSPEMVNKNLKLLNVFSRVHERQKLARIVIDEAHCVSQWGHDFRPDYKTLGDLRDRYPGVPIIALTATATENVKVDVMHNLGIMGCEVFTQSFNRPNLTYEVRPKGKKQEVMDSIANTIKSKHRGMSGIIYTLSRKSCEEIAGLLQKKYKIEAQYYHASLKPDDKARVQREWQAGRWQVVVATIAFGMGIDKADVRFVIHHTIPKSLEGYYQETGRAGRDGKQSSCYLYYGYQDTVILKAFITESDGSAEQKERQRKMLNRMVQFCENKHDCRRVQVLNYFGEQFQKENCNHTCDSCSSESVFETQDFTEVAKAALNVVGKFHRDKVTLLHCVDIIRGSKHQNIINRGHDNVAGYGKASDMQRGEVERIFYRLLSEDALAEENVVNRAGFATQYLRLGLNYRDFLSGRRKLKLQIRVSPRRPRVNHQASKQHSKRSTEVSAALEVRNHPQSTDVSSPVHAASKRRKAKNLAHDEGSDNEMHDFVASESSDAEYFEPIREGGIRLDFSRSMEVGPPITSDKQMLEANISDVHQDVIRHFVPEAKKLEEKIRNERGQQKRPFFTERDFREMAINWTTTVDDMLEIRGINTENVKRYGARFLPLIERYHDNYETMMGHREDRDMDQSHQNVIDLISDDEKSSPEASMTVEDYSSKYWKSSETMASNGKPNQTARRGASQQKRSASPRGKQKYYRGNRGSFRGGQSARGSYGGNNRSQSRGGFRKSSDNFQKARTGEKASNGVSKARASSKRPSVGSSTSGKPGCFQQFARKSDGVSRGGNGFGGFDMMPTD